MPIQNHLKLLAALCLVVGGGCGAFDVAPENENGSGGRENGGNGGTNGGTNNGTSNGGSTDQSGCIADTRVAVLTESDVEPIHYYKMNEGGGFTRIFPSGDPPAAITRDGGEVDGFSGFALDGGRFVLVDNEGLYAVSTSTLEQVNIRDSERTLFYSGFPSLEGVALARGWLMGFGFGIEVMDLDTPFASSEEVASGYYHGGISFSYDGNDFIAGVEEDGYHVLQVHDAVPPTSHQVVDDYDWFGAFGNSNIRRGIAFDDVTGTLLLGNSGGVVLASGTSGFFADVDDEWMMPTGTDAKAITAAGGFAYVAMGSSGGSESNLFRLDLNDPHSTPVAGRRWNDNGGYTPQWMTLACGRLLMVFSGAGGDPSLLAFDQDTLEPIGGGPHIDQPRQVLTASKSALAIAGDE
jgi:hypothetical protein